MDNKNINISSAHGWDARKVSRRGCSARLALTAELSFLTK